jgi:hypothetical protein
MVWNIWTWFTLRIHFAYKIINNNISRQSVRLPRTQSAKSDIIALTITIIKSIGSKTMYKSWWGGIGTFTGSAWCSHCSVNSVVRIEKYMIKSLESLRKLIRPVLWRGNKIGLAGCVLIYASLCISGDIIWSRVFINISKMRMRRLL